jgi:adenylate cyclase
MNYRDRPPAVWIVPLVTLLLALLAFGTDAGGMTSLLRNRLFDSYQASQPRPYQTTPIKVLDIDEASVARFGPWPWPHGTLARLVDDLKAQGAAMVVFAFPIDRSDSASPKNLIALVPPGPAFDAARAALIRMPAPDDALARSMRGLPTVTGFMLGDARPARHLMLKPTIELVGTGGGVKRIRAYDQASPTLDSIAEASAGFGAFNLADDPGADATARRMPMVLRLKDKLVPSLEAEVLRLYQNQTVLTLKTDGDNSLFGRSALRAVETAKGEIPTLADGSIWIAFSGPRRERLIRAGEVTDRSIASGRLSGAIVYIGAPDDLVETPCGLMSTAEVHAEAAEALLTGKVLRRPAAAVAVELLCLALFGLVLIVLFARFGTQWAVAFAVCAVVLSFIVSRQLFARDGVLFDSLGFSVGLMLTALASFGTRLYEIRRTRNWLLSAFENSLPKRRINLLARQPHLLESKGVTRTISYLSCGVRGFSELAASFRGDPAAFTNLMQRVLEPLMSEAMRRGGTIGTMSGDGFTAYWNAPLDDSEHAAHACEAASSMTVVVAKVNEVITRERRSDGVALAPVEIGIGVSTGPVVAGGIAAHGRMVYAVNGDCVAEAEHIRRISGQYGPAVIVSEDARKAAEHGFALLEVDTIVLDPSNEPVKLYAMLGNPVMRASPKFRALATFHEHIFQSIRMRQWYKARELILQCRKLSGASQKLYELHLARIAVYEKNPPPEDWDGVYRPAE